MAENLKYIKNVEGKTLLNLPSFAMQSTSINRGKDLKLIRVKKPFTLPLFALNERNTAYCLLYTLSLIKPFKSGYQYEKKTKIFSISSRIPKEILATRLMLMYNNYTV